jgi:hypothetical protein
MKLAKAKSLFLKALIGCLIAAAVLAVVTVLVGRFNDLLAKALFTILLIAIHCLMSFAFISNNEQQETFESLTFFSNATFAIIVLSFITSVLGVWSVLPGVLVAKMYAVYFILLFATLHGNVLAQTLGKQKSITNLVYANYVFMALVVLLLLPVIFLNDRSTLGSFYYRLLAACGIVDATLTLIVVILHKLYVQKHPTVHDAVFNIPLVVGQGQPMVPGQGAPHYAQAPAPVRRRGTNIFVIILVSYIVIQLVGGLFVVVLGSLVFR